MPVARAARPAARTPRGPGRSAARAVLAAHHDEANEEIYGIAELSREFGISPRAIRFYEAKGLLKPRRVNGARVYTRRDRARLSLILRAKAIGSSLAEIRHYLDLYGSRGRAGSHSCATCWPAPTRRSASSSSGGPTSRPRWPNSGSSMTPSVAISRGRPDAGARS